MMNKNFQWPSMHDHLINAPVPVSVNSVAAIRLHVRCLHFSWKSWRSKSREQITLADFTMFSRSAWLTLSSSRFSTWDLAGTLCFKKFDGGHCLDTIWTNISSESGCEELTLGLVIEDWASCKPEKTVSATFVFWIGMTSISLSLSSSSFSTSFL